MSPLELQSICIESLQKIVIQNELSRYVEIYLGSDLQLRLPSKDLRIIIVTRD